MSEWGRGEREGGGGYLFSFTDFSFRNNDYFIFAFNLNVLCNTIRVATVVDVASWPARHRCVNNCTQKKQHKNHKKLKKIRVVFDCSVKFNKKKL